MDTVEGESDIMSKDISSPPKISTASSHSSAEIRALAQKLALEISLLSSSPDILAFLHWTILSIDYHLKQTP